MKTCTSCDSESPDEAHFCGNCGAALAVRAVQTCESCGSESPDNARFCLNCGAALTAREVPEAPFPAGVADAIGPPSVTETAATRPSPAHPEALDEGFLHADAEDDELPHGLTVEDGPLTQRLEALWPYAWVVMLGIVCLIGVWRGVEGVSR